MNTPGVEKNLRILVIDDNRAVHGDFRKILCAGTESGASLAAAEEVLFGERNPGGTDETYQVDSAYQGEEGLEKVQQAAAAGRPYAVAFVDVRMPPGWDGVETAGRLWACCPELQIVICTAYSDYSWSGMLAQLGCNHRLLILKKPFDTVEVFQLAHSLTEKWRLEQEAGQKLEQLDRLVRERTADLNTSHESLKTEIFVRQEAEARIREQARMLDLAHDAIHVRAWDGSVRYWNKSAERLYGWTAEEALGTRIGERLHPDPANRATECQARARIEQGEWSGELHRQTKAGGQIIVHSRWTLVRDGNGQPQSILIIDTDITAKKELEAQFLQAQRVDSIGTLATGIAHDLNNILAPVMMIGPLLRAEIKNRATLSLLETMETGAQRGADIVKQILTFARGTRNTTSPLPTARLLKEFSNFIRESLPSNIALNVVLPKELWPVEGNSTELHQVLVNLCQNAREAMPGGGIITLSAVNQTLDAPSAAAIPNARPGRYVVWSVVDNGVGIVASNLHRVFDPFFTTKEVGKGPGLGLSTVLGLVNHRGGCIQLRSTAGRGTEVKVYLRAAADRPQPVRFLPELPDGAGKLVLVLDADETMAGVVQKVLAASGYRVLASSDEIEALEIYRRNWRQTEVVLADLMMPEMATVLSAIRQTNPGVKLLGSSTLPADQIPVSLRLPEEQFLRKPYQTKALLDALRHILSSPDDASIDSPAQPGARQEDLVAR